MTTQIKDATGATVTRMTFDDIVGTAGSANSNVMSIQGISGGTPLPIALPSNAAQETGGNLATIATNSATIVTNTAAGVSRTVTGNVASGSSDSGNPVKIGAVYNSTTPTLTTGQRADLQTGTRGSLKVQLMNFDSANPVSVTVNPPDGQSANFTGLTVQGYNFRFNGTTWDRDRKTNLYKRVASSAASGNPDFLKASAGDLTQFWGQNGAAITYLQVYNKASAPTIGTDTPILTYPIPANATFNQIVGGTYGAYFSTGIAFAFTTDAAGTTGASAAAVTAFAIMGA